MPIGPTSGFLDFTNATPRANVIVALSNIGIGTDVPLHALDLRGTANVADIIINNDLTLTGGLTTNSLTINSMSMSTTSNFQQVTNVGNVTTNTVEFTNPTTGLAVTSNAEVGGELSVSGNAEVSGELSVSGNVEVGTANLFVDTTTGNVGIGTGSPSSRLQIETSSTSSGAVMNIDTSSITNTGYSEILMTGPGGNNQQLSIFCNGSGRTVGGGANATTIRNNIGPIILGRSSYETRLINPVDTTFVAGMWTQTINSTTVTTTIKKNIGSCMTTKTPDGYGSASGFSGSAGVFVAPFDGLYQFQCVCFAQGTGSNLLIVFNANGPSVTDGTWSTRNVVGDYHEAIDLRGITNQEEPHGFSVLLDMKQDDAVDVQNHSTGYLGGDLLRCSCFLVHRL